MATTGRTAATGDGTLTAADKRTIKDSVRRASDLRTLALVVLAVSLIPIAGIGQAAKSDAPNAMFTAIAVALGSLLLAAVLSGILHGVATVIDLSARTLQLQAQQTERANLDRL